MELKNCSGETTVIKFAVESYMGVGGNPVVLFMEAVEWLYNCYKKTGDEICLKASIQIIKAYMEMGLLYETAKDIFDKILGEEGVIAIEVFPKRVYTQNLLKRKATHVREVLGYWPKAKNKNCNAEWITKDILEKVEKRDMGCFYYGKKEDIFSFELLVLKEEANLLDSERKKIYVFEQ